MDGGVLTAALGTVLLAMGASALNEWQERDYDALMVRTRNRPLPAGALSAPVALAVALLLGASGFGVLVMAHGWTAALLGVLAMVWYNGVYTPLKRVTAFAAVPGSLIGAIPPAIGWTAAGGNLTDPALVALCAVFFIWQVPHFWLLLLMIGDQYADAGLPTLTRIFSRTQLFRITFIWILATAVCGMAFPAFRNAYVGLPWNALILVASLWLCSKAAGMLYSGPRGDDARPFRRAFMQINVYALIVMLALSFNALGLRW
jgi:protoheme IX farnesyltransferase